MTVNVREFAATYMYFETRKIVQYKTCITKFICKYENSLFLL